MQVSIRQGRIEDAGVLAALGAKLFYQTYAGQMPAQDIEAYIAAEFSREQQRRELADGAITTLVAESGGEAVGYAQLRKKPLPVEHDLETSLELWRIYLDKSFQGKGAGRQLLARVGEAARAMPCERIWLGVWEENRKAIAFYQHCGFVAVGAQEFRAGDEIQTDIVMVGSANAF